MQTMPHLEFPSASPEDLELQIGRHLLADDLGSKPVSDDEARAVGHRWFENRLEGFRLSVCANPIVMGHLTGAKVKARNELFAAVVDSLLTISGHGGVPVTTLAARLIHYGVGVLCPDCAHSAPK
jgi:hypothetical protein